MLNGLIKTLRKMKERISKIVDMLIQSTTLRLLTWYETMPGNLNRRKSEREMFATGEDGTVFNLNIRYSTYGEKCELDKCPDLYIRSINLPNGLILASSSSYINVVKLRDIIKDKFCQDMVPPTSDIEDSLDNIYKNISLSLLRDNKIDEILDKK